jgi:hypothetical protein
MTTTDVKDIHEITSETLDVIEDTLDLLENKALWVSSNPKALVVAVGLVGVAVGGVATYLIVSKKLSAKYEALAQQEIDSVKARYSFRIKEGEAADPITLAEALGVEEEVVVTDNVTAETIIGKQNYASISTSKPTDEEPKPASVVVQNVFRETEGSEVPVMEDWDYEVEQERRSPATPYIVHRDEFFENEPEHDQVSITYFAGDDVLVDERDQPMPNASVGDDNLDRFGHGSGDPNVLYVRNEHLGLDFSIALSKGKFADVINGSLQHSDTRDRRPRRFRTYDD